MRPLRRLTELPLVDVSLCRAGGRTCAACCYGESVSRRDLHQSLARQTALFHRLIGDRNPGRLRCLLHEVRARQLPGLLWALLLLVPIVSAFVRPWLRRRTVCAFLGYEDEEQSRVGCLLHPARRGVDRRQQSAFALWRGFGCGPANYLCLAAYRYALAGWRSRKRFFEETRTLGWFDYGRRAATFGAGSATAQEQIERPAAKSVRER